MSQGSAPILEALDQLSASEKQVYFKIIRGGSAWGSKGLGDQRTRGSIRSEEAVLAHRLMGGLDATPEAFQHWSIPNQAKNTPCGLYPFFLAPRLMASSSVG